MADPFSLLGDDDSDDYPEDSFRVNKEFSGSYKIWRQKEELAKLKHMSDSSSESESEDEPVIDKEFLNALGYAKSGNPIVYKGDEVAKKPKAKKEKPMFVKDLERELVLKEDGEVDEDEQDPRMTLAKEEDQERMAFGADSSDEEDDNLLSSKTKAEDDAEDADYILFLKGQRDNVDGDAEGLKHLRKVWNDPNIDEGEKFLRDYILNFDFKKEEEMYLTHETPAVDFVTLSEDEEITKQQEMFEHKYNFRYEEPDPEYIKRYPRTIGGSLRREDTRRKQKREDYNERKKKEKEQHREELKRLKAIKRKEIEERFQKLQEISGKEHLNFDEEDMDSDFDPDKHDRKMRELFNDDYYAVEEQQKPEFEYDEELDNEKWDHWTRETDGMEGTKQGDEKEEEADESADEDNERINAREEFEQEMIDSSRVGRKRSKKKSLFSKIISQSKPIYDPERKSFNDYLDEYYKMDFEDVIGDLPVRFKYREVPANDFGLTCDEILAANDKELNRWCSIKKTCQYRRDEEEIYDVQAFQKKAQNLDLKKKILTSVYSLPKEDDKVSNPEVSESTNVKRKKKRSKKKKLAEHSGETTATESKDTAVENEEDNILQSKEVDEPKEFNVEDSGKCKSKKKKKKNKSLVPESSNPLPLDEIQVNEQKDFSSNFSNNVQTSKKRKRTTSIVESETPSNEVSEPEEPSMVLTGESKKRKKRKKNIAPVEIQVNEQEYSSNFSNSKTSKKLEHTTSLEEFKNPPSKKDGPEKGSNKKSRKKKKKPKKEFSNTFRRDFTSNAEAQKILSIPNQRLASYGLNSKKFKNKIIYS